MDRSSVARELERRMALLGLTQKALSRNAGVGDTYVRDILKGKSRNPGGEKLERVASILGCTARDLLFPAGGRRWRGKPGPPTLQPRTSPKLLWN
ncbi:helix-turn-helix domain-containing protein [Acetobacter persici]|uniref:HTH cro/C1-type domain-containing protein n=1 Tax=Acetobacter persici TaxID=1076596 RepID=A0A1U9LFQ8_9PROT|nr:helix-turn-helix transcriptional regulator [Acetobacter persici]AQT05303.1 hypothetical protein A0U91_11010 [Acetobacter persici]